MRHSIATHMLAAGLREIQGFLGHSQIQTTIYAQVDLTRLKSTIDRVTGLLESE